MTKIVLSVFVLFLAFPLFIGLAGSTIGPGSLVGGFPVIFGGAMIVLFSRLQRSQRGSTSRSLWGARSEPRQWAPGQRWAAPPLPAPVAWGRPGTYVVTNHRVMTIEPSGLESSLPLGDVVPTVMRRTTSTSAVAFATRNPVSPPLVFESQPIAEIDRIMEALRPPSIAPPPTPGEPETPWTDPFELPTQAPIQAPPPTGPTGGPLGPYHWTPPGSEPPPN